MYVFPIVCLFPNNLKDLLIVLKTRDLAQGLGTQGKYATPSDILLYVLIHLSFLIHLYFFYYFIYKNWIVHIVSKSQYIFT